MASIFDPNNPWASPDPNLTPDQQNAWNTAQNTWQQGYQNQSAQVARGLNPGYTPPSGATLNQWGYYQLPSGDLAPGQTTPGSSPTPFTPFNANGQLNQQGQAAVNAAPTPVSTPAPPTSPGGTPPPAQTSTGPAGPPVTPAGISGAYSSIFGALPPGPSTTISAPVDAQDPALRKAIMDAISQGEAPVTANDPLIAPVLSSMQGQAQRAEDLNAQQTAERLYGQGTPVSSGAYDTATRGFNQQMAEALTGQTGNLMLQQLNDRQNRLMTALNIGSNYLTAAQQRSLQAELASTNAAIQSYGMQLGASSGLLGQMANNYFGSAGLGLSYAQLQALLNGNAANAFLGGF